MNEKNNYSDIKSGDKFKGKVIKQVYASADNFIFYRHKWKKSLGFSWTGIDVKCINPIAPLTTEITGLLSKIGNSKKYNDQIATAYLQCILNHPENAIKILEEVKSNVKKDIIKQSKINYLFYSIIILLINTAVSLALFYTKNFFPTGPFRGYFTVATFGSYGGFISILYKINKLKFEDENGKALLFFLALSRAFISMLSSVIIYVLIKSNVMLGILNDVDNVYVFYIFSVVAGFSESFVPDILSNIEKKAKEE